MLLDSRNFNIQPSNCGSTQVEYFSGIVNDYYKGIGVGPSNAGSLFSNPEVVNVDCDPILYVNNLLNLVKEPVSNVLSVIGPNAPEIFRKKFPQAKISAFDINPRQLATYTPQINSKGGEVFVADIVIPGQITNLFEKVKPEVVFLSNISEYMSPQENLTFGDEILNLANRYSFNLVLTEVESGVDIPCMNVTNRNSLRLKLWEYFAAAGLKHEFEYVKNSSKSAHLFRTKF